MSQDPDNQSMYGWLICRFDKKQIHSILYGQFSRQQLPPSTGWVFLAKDAAELQKDTDIMKLSREGLDGKGLSLFAKGVDPDDFMGCINSVTGSAEDGISVTPAFLQNDREPGAPTTRYYVLRNCPIPAVNGRYMEGGFYEGAPLYRNVREWALVRTKLAEMPELGISAKGSYAIQEGSSISEIYHEAAAAAYEEILTSSDIKDGTFDFKKRYIALSRAGNRMITSDQSMQLDFVNQKRAALRTKLSNSLLQSLQEVRLGTAPADAMHITAAADATVPEKLKTTSVVDKPHAVPAPSAFPSTASLPPPRSNVPLYMNETLESCAPDTIKTASGAGVVSVAAAPANQGQGGQDDQGSVGSASAAGSTLSKAQKQPVAEMDSTEVGVEIDITLGRSISYQQGSQGFAMNRLVGDAEAERSGTGAFEDQYYLDAESELAREVTVCIEEREAALAALKMEAAMLSRDFARGEEEQQGLSQFNQSVFGSAPGNSGFATSPHSNFASAQNTARSGVSNGSFSPTSRSSRPRSADYYLQRVEPLLDKMREVRKLTVAFADAFGAWARLLHKQKAAKWRREKKKAEQFGASFKKMSRTYVVALAHRSSQELYALSQAVKSSVKKFSRDMEPVKYATEIKLVGVYDTKDEAVAAFDKAFGEIPQEYLLLADIKAVNKKQIGLRKCGQHYIVRSSGVPQDMECEQCSLLKQQQAKAASGVPELYKEEPISQFIWNGTNYLEKMWTDLDFLSSVEYLKRALPEENFRSNPLMLSNASIQELLHSMHVHKRAGSSFLGHSLSAAPKAAVTSSSGSASGKTPAAEPRHPLNGLRGKQELLRDAARAGDRHNAELKQQAYETKYRDDPYNNTGYFGSLKDRAANRDASAEENGATAADHFESADRADDFLFGPSSVFYETTVGILGSDFGQPVEVHEVQRSKYQSSAFSSRGGTSNFRSMQASPANGLETSLLTSSLRASHSAPVLLDNNARPGASREPTAGNSGKTSSVPGTVAGNGAAGVKGIKSAGAAKLRDKYTTAASPYAPTVTDLVPLPVAQKTTRLAAHAEDAALLSTKGLDLNKYLNEDVRASSSSAGMANNVTGFPGIAARSSNQLATSWDEDFLQDSVAHRERLARALQVIGQCPVPVNAIRSSSPTSTERHVSQTSGFNGTGPEAFSATVGPGGAETLRSSTQVAAASPAKKENMTLVESFYAFRGAQMSIVQERRAVAHRTEETFCRSDVGEWKGFSKGRAMRAFEFQDNLYTTGKKLEEDRKRLQQLLRAAISVDIIDCDVTHIRDLIAEAEKLRGSMLALDIAQAETFLRQYRAVCKYALRGQAWFRGQRDRARVREMRRKIREKKKHYRTTEVEAAKLAPLLVADLLTKCVAVQVSREKRSVFRFTMNMTGVLCMVSLRRQSAPFRKPVSVVELCAGCNTQCIITKYEHADRSYSKDRAPCTCVLVSPQEEWQLNIYNPLNRESFQHTVSVTQARQMLRGIESAVKFMRTSHFAYESLVGPSFGHLTPLFGQPEGPQSSTSQQGHADSTIPEQDEAFSGRRLDRSFSMALLNSAAESAVLPRLPLLLPDQISSIVNSTGLHFYEPSEYCKTNSTVPARRVAGYNRLPMLDGCKASEVISDQDGPFDPQWDWRPLFDMRIIRKEIERNAALSEDFKNAVVASEESVRDCAAVKVVAYADIEHAQMVYEDARGLVLRAHVSIDIAARRIEEVMRFGKQLETEMHLEEKGEMVNDHQSHDLFESASGWVGLNQKRQLERLHAKLFADCETKCKAFLHVHTAYAEACQALRCAEDRHMAALLRFENHRPVIAQRTALLREMQVKVRAAANAVLMTYSLPRKRPSVLAPHLGSEAEGVQQIARYSGSRRLQRIPWNLIFVRDPLERLRMQNRAPLAVLQRRVMKLAPQQRTLDKRIKGTLRCVVLVLLDELTGLIVLHIGQSEAVVEESNQHIDLNLQKSDFSNLTSHGLENDIILQPEDVDWLLSIPVEMSSENLTRANKYARGKVQGLLPDPNKLRAGDDMPGPAAYTPHLVLPSQALRSIGNTKAHPVYNSKLRALKSTYLQRRDEKEQHEIKRADQILRYLRLQAHTGRPCVGLLHFRRRLTYSHQHINASSWLSDLVNADPLLLVNHLSSKTFLLNDDIVMVHMYNNMRRFNVDVQLPFPVHPSTINTEVSLQQVIVGLQPQPLLLASFLWEFVTNSFSPQSLVRVFQDVDWELPGQLAGSYWRRPGPDEIPRPHFMIGQDQKYRGPIYQRHRFVSSKYFLAKLHLSAFGDLRIALMRPEDGKFHHHQYEGETLFVDISRAELCAIVAKLSVDANLVPLEMFGTVLLLHHHNVHILFALMLEVVHLTLHHRSSSSVTELGHHRHAHGKAHGEKRTRSGNRSKIAPKRAASPAAPAAIVSGHVVLSQLSADGSQHYDVAVNLAPLLDKTLLLFEKYNNWVNVRHAALLCPLQDDATRALHKYIGRFAPGSIPSEQLSSGEVEYQVLTEKDPSNKQQMRIYHSVWQFLDLNKFFGDPLQPPLLQCAAQLMKSRKGASFRALRQLREAGGSGVAFPSYSMGADCFDTLMGVDVLTNVAKTRLLIDISTIDLTHADAQAVVNYHEQELFAEEDQLSSDLRVRCALTEAKLSLAREFKRLDQYVQITLLPQQQALTKRCNQATECLAVMQKQFLAAYDECADLLSQTVLQHAMSVLFTDGSVAAPYQHARPGSSLRTTLIKVPLFLQSEALIVTAADWMNDVLRKQRQILASATPAAVRLECRQSADQHEPVPIYGSVVLGGGMPGFSTATLPRSQVQSAHSGASRLEQLGAEFRDPDRWYYAKRLSRNKQTRSMQSYQAYLESTPADAAVVPSGRAAVLKGQLIGRKIFTGATLSAVLSRPCLTGAESAIVADVPSFTCLPDDLFVLMDATTYVNGMACIDVFSLSTHTVLRLYALCSSPNSDGDARVEGGELSVVSADQLMEQRRSVQDEMADRMRALQEKTQSIADSVCAEISKTVVESTRLQEVFTGLSCHMGLPALQQITQEVSAVRWSSDDIVSVTLSAANDGGDLSDVGGSPVATKRKGKSSKSRRRRHEQRSVEWDSASFRSFSESPESVKSKRGGRASFPVLGFYIPADESLPAVCLNSTTDEWHDTLTQYLVPAQPVCLDGSTATTEHVLKLHRKLSAFGIMYWKHREHQHPHHNTLSTPKQSGAEHSEPRNVRAIRLQTMFDQRHPERALPRHTSAHAQNDQQHSHHHHHHNHHHDHHEHVSAEVCGDTVMLMRYGLRDLSDIEDMLRLMQEEYAPMRALRLLKEGRERQWRLSNHAKFRQLVFGLAFPCLTATENVYGVLKHAVSAEDGCNPFPAPVPQLHSMPLFQLRLILTKFNDLLKCFYAHRRLHTIDAELHWRALQFAGLMDYSLVSASDNILAHFDEKCPDDLNLGAFGRRSGYLRHMVLPVAEDVLLKELLPPAGCDILDRYNEADDNKFYFAEGHSGTQLDITAGQVVYAMYQLHCYNCSTPMHLCRFPGCSIIRGDAAAHWASDLDNSAPFLGILHMPDVEINVGGTEASPVRALAQVKGSGLHPIDVAIKNYFLSTFEAFTRYPALYLPGHHAPHIPTDKTAGGGDGADEEIEEQDVIATSVAPVEELSVEDEVAAEEQLDRSVIHKRNTDDKLRLRYAELKEEAAQLYALHHALVRREVTGSISFRELLMAKGGMYALSEEAAIRKLIAKVLVTHTAAANAEYSAYDASAGQQLVRLVPSATLLAELAAGGLDDGELDGAEGEGGDGSEGEEESGGSRSGSSGSGSGSGSSSGGSSADDDGSDVYSVSSDGTSITSTEKLTLQAVVHVKQTHSIPIDILQALSHAEINTVESIDLHGKVFDPYPPISAAEQVLLHDVPHSARHHINPMPTAMYDVLMRRLRLTRTNRIASQPNYSAATSSTELATRRTSSTFTPGALVVNEKQSHYFRFDRLHHEQVVVLQDGSVVVVQFLHGILQGASLVIIQPKKNKKKTKLSLFANNDVYPNIEVYENVSGAPPAALRFIHTSKLPTVKPGLTVAVFDALSTVSRAFIIEQRSIKRTCEAFGVDANDYSGLAKKIGSLAHQCIQVTRAGLYCTTVMFSVASLHEERTQESHEERRTETDGDSCGQLSRIRSLSPAALNGPMLCSPQSGVGHSPVASEVVDAEKDVTAELSSRYAYSQDSVYRRFSAVATLLSDMVEDELSA